MFPAGIYDTKFIAEYVERERASYLAYLYRKYEREQTNRQRDPSASFVSCEIQGRLKVPVVVNAAVSSPSQKLLAATKAATAASGSQKRKSDKSPSAVEVCQKYAVIKKIITSSLCVGCFSSHSIFSLCIYLKDHGYCMFGNSCPRSHDLDIILDQQEAEELQKKRQESNKKRFKKSNASGGEDATAATEESMAPVVVAVVEDQPTGSADGRIAATSSLSSKRVVPVKMSMATAAAKSSVASSYSSVTNTPQLPGSSSGDTFETYHSAHFDAYMTAFVFARQKLAGLVSPETISDPSVGDPKNKLYLMGKPIPLRIEKSAFVKYSKGHMERWEQLKRENVL